MATSLKKNFLPPNLIANLQQVLISRNDGVEDQEQSRKPASDQELSQTCSSSLFSCSETEDEIKAKEIVKPVVLVTNAEGIESLGLTLLVEALVRDDRLDICVCAPRSDRSVSGHSLTVRETLAVCSAEINGATAYEVSGTPADCVSLALSGALFSWSKPVLVISGINRGSSSGHNMLSSGAVAGAREALICGVPSLCISLNWKKGTSSDNELKDAVNACLPIVYAAIDGAEKGVFPNDCFLNIEIPSCPLSNKGLKVTRQSEWRSSLSWQSVSTNRHRPSAPNFMSNQQSLGIKLAQLGRDASGAGAARRFNSHRKNVEIESVGVAGKLSSQHQQTVKKYFRLEVQEKNHEMNSMFLEKEQETVDEDLDITALQDGFIAITPLTLSSTVHSEIQTTVSNWILDTLSG